MKRVVVKLGSNAVTKEEGGLDLKKLKTIVKDIVALHQQGLEVIVVSSGAVATGKSFLEKQKWKTIDYLQACSAVGQPLLMRTYIELFRKANLTCAQVLLTHDDFKNKTRYLNAKQTLLHLLKNGVIPILNENDSVSFAEITLGDNDQLGAMVTEMMDGDLLCFLTESDGLFNKDPKSEDPEDSTPLIHYKNVKYHDTLEGIGLKTKSTHGRGGMKTKLLAVRKLTDLGIPVIIGSYTKKRPLLRLLEKKGGTFFEAKNLERKSKKKAWILTTVKDQAGIVVDEGACQAILNFSSLLPSGIVGIQGQFRRGDCVNILFENQVIGVGICEYDSLEVKKIMGEQSRNIYKILGHYLSNVVIHRDNLVLKKAS